VAFSVRTGLHRGGLLVGNWGTGEMGGVEPEVIFHVHFKKYQGDLYLEENKRPGLEMSLIPT